MHPSPEFTEKCVKNKNNPISGSSVDEKRGQRRMARLVQADRKVIQITTSYNSGVLKSISERQTLKQQKTASRSTPVS